MDFPEKKNAVIASGGYWWWVYFPVTLMSIQKETATSQVFHCDHNKKKSISCLFKNSEAKYAMDGSSVGGCKMCSENYFLCDLISSFWKSKLSQTHCTIIITNSQHAYWTSCVDLKTSQAAILGQIILLSFDWDVLCDLWCMGTLCTQSVMLYHHHKSNKKK